MADKRKSDTANGGQKRKRKAIDLDQKLSILNKHDDGVTVSVIARDLDISKSTISTIIKDSSRIREAGKSSIPMKATIITKKRRPIHKMEKLLVVWMEDHIQKRIPLSLKTIQAKARSLFDELKKKESDDYDQSFNASNGWFNRFRNRANFHSVKISGEAASSDFKGAEKFIDEFDKGIVDENYLPEQIFDMDETGLQWKKMPERTYIHKEAKTMPGVKAFKDRITPVLGGNVAEDIDQLVEAVPEELTNEDLIELEAAKQAEEKRLLRKEKEDTDDEPPKCFVLKDMAKSFSLINKGMQMFELMDPNVARYCKVDRLIQEAMACYKEIYAEKKKHMVQSKLDLFFKKGPDTAVPPMQPTPSTSTAKNEEYAIDDASIVTSNSSV